jgi:hypothetical protein
VLLVMLVLVALRPAVLLLVRQVLQA